MWPGCLPPLRDLTRAQSEAFSVSRKTVVALLRRRSALQPLQAEEALEGVVTALSREQMLLGSPC